MSVVLMAWSVNIGMANDDDDDDAGGPERPWELLVGGGIISESAYNGSDSMEFSPFPFIHAIYSTQYMDFFASIDEGVGVALKGKFWESLPISLSVAAALGDNGREISSSSLLKGTPELKNPYQLVGRLNLELPFATMTSSVRYLPISSEYKETDRKDVDYDGVAVDVNVSREQWLKEWLMLEIGAGVSWMGKEYAEANYDVTYATERLSRFNASSGFERFTLSATGVVMFSERLGLATIADTAFLIGDAADSPLTENTFQPEFGLSLFYRF